MVPYCLHSASVSSCAHLSVAVLISTICVAPTWQPGAAGGMGGKLGGLTGGFTGGTGGFTGGIGEAEGMGGKVGGRIGGNGGLTGGGGSGGGEDTSPIQTHVLSGWVQSAVPPMQNLAYESA